MLKQWLWLLFLLLASESEVGPEVFSHDLFSKAWAPESCANKDFCVSAGIKPGECVKTFRRTDLSQCLSASVNQRSFVSLKTENPLRWSSALTPDKSIYTVNRSE